MNYKLHQIFLIPGIKEKFEYSLVSNNDKKQQSLIRHAVKRFIFPLLNITTFEELYVNQYNGKIDICQFCNKNYVHIDFRFELGENNILQMIYVDPKKYLCDNKECKCQRKKYNPNSIYFVSKAYRLSEKDANEYILSRNNSPFYFHKDRETKEEYSARQRRDLKYFIDKYGKQDGKKRYLERNKKTGIGNTYESLVLKYGEEKANQICKSKAITLENMIKVHGKEDGEKAYQQWLERIGFASSYDGMVIRHGKEWADNYIAKLSYICSYEGMIELYGLEKANEKIKNWSYKSSKEYLEKTLSPEQLSLRLHKLATNTLQHFIEKYGDELGPIKYIEHQHKYFEKRHPKIFENRLGKHVDSFQAYLFFQQLEIEICNVFPNIKKNDIYYADAIDRHEYRIDYLNKDGKLRWYKLDFSIPKIKLNIEFNGEYYHPKITNDQQYIDYWNKLHNDDNAYNKYMINYNNRKYIINDLHNFKTFEVYDFNVNKTYKISNMIQQILKFIKDNCI